MRGSYGVICWSTGYCSFVEPLPSWPGLSHGCPVRFFWAKRTALILIISRVWRLDLDMKRDQRRAAYEYGFPRHFETPCPGLPLSGLWRSTGPTSWCAVSRPSGSCWRCCLVNCRGRIRCATSKPRCRAIRRGFIMRAAPTPARSTFADANRGRNYRVFSGLFTSYAGDDDAWPAPQDGRCGTADQLDRPAPGGRRAPSGRAFRPRFAGPRRMSSMIPIWVARSTT